MGNCESELQNAYDDVISINETYDYNLAVAGYLALPRQFPHMVSIHIYIYIKINFVCCVENHIQSYHNHT